MPAFSTLTLNRIKRTVATTLTSIALIEQRNVGSSQYGSLTSGWTVVAAAVPCRLISIGGRMKTSSALVGEALSMRDSYRLIVASNQALGVGMRVTIIDPDSHLALVYDVASVADSDSDSVFNEAFVTRQRGDQL